MRGSFPQVFDGKVEAEGLGQPTASLVLSNLAKPSPRPSPRQPASCCIYGQVVLFPGNLWSHTSFTAPSWVRDCRCFACFGSVHPKEPNPDVSREGISAGSERAVRPGAARSRERHASDPPSGCVFDGGATRRRPVYS